MDKHDTGDGGGIVGAAFAWLFSVPSPIHRRLSAALIARYGQERAAEITDTVVADADTAPFGDLAWTADLDDTAADTFTAELADALGSDTPVTDAAPIIAAWHTNTARPDAAATGDGVPTRRRRQPLPSLRSTGRLDPVELLDAGRTEREHDLDAAVANILTAAHNTADTNLDGDGEDLAGSGSDGAGADDAAGGERCRCGALADELAQVVAERDERTDDLQRVQASFENYRKRVLADRDAAGLAALRDTLQTLLPVLDDVDLLADHHPDVAAAVAASVTTTITRLGVTRIIADGEPFDPNIHEAVATVDDDTAEPGTVTRTLRCGWAHDGHVLRAALVEVRR